MDNTFIIDNLLRQNECDSLAFKKTLAEEKIAQEVVAMLNSRGGDILVGVDDNKNVIGLKTQINASQLLNVLTTYIQPAAPIDVQDIIYNEKSLLLIRVWEGTQKPYTYKGKVYQKTSADAVSGIGQMIADRRNADANWERMPVLSASIEDLDIDEVRQTMKMCQQSNSKNYLDEESFLTETGLIQNGNLTNACIVLYARNPMRYIVQSGIRLSVFSSESASDLIDSQNFEGNVFKNVDAIFQYIDNCYLRTVSIDGILRSERWNYPRVAVREGIMNAIVHRDYNSYQSFLQIYVYPNHLDIANYGVTDYILSFIDSGHPSYSSLRNPDIAYHCYYRRLIEMRGTGIPRMLADCKTNGFESPQFSTNNRVVRLAFPQLQLQRIMSNQNEFEKLLGQKIAPLNANVKQKMASVLSVLSKQPGLRASTICNLTGIPTKSLERYLSELKNKGIVAYQGSKKDGGYYLVSNSNK